MATDRREPARRRREPAARRDELIDAGIELLRNGGERATRVEDVALAAGAAKGTFYLYFDTWAEFLVAVRDRILDDDAAGVRERFGRRDAALSWERLLAEELRSYVEFHVELGPLHDAVFHGAAADAPIDPGRSTVSLIATVLAAGSDAGAFRPVDVDACASMILAAAHSTADLVAAGAAPDATTAALTDFVLHALRPD